MQFSQNESINFPNSNEILASIQNGTDINQLLRDLHQPIIEILNSNDFISDQTAFKYLTNDLPILFLTAIKHSAHRDELKSLYRDFIQLTINSNFDFNMIKALSYPFEKLEIPQKPFHLFERRKKELSPIQKEETSKSDENLFNNQNEISIQLDTTISNNETLSKPTQSNSSKTSKNQVKTDKGTNPVLLNFSRLLYDSNLFSKATDLILDDKFTLAQFSCLLNLFIDIEPYLTNEKADHYIDFFEIQINRILPNIEKIEFIDELHIFNFISSAIPMLVQSDIDFFYQHICRLLSQTLNTELSPNTILEIQKTILNAISKISRKYGFSNSTELIKQTCLEVISKRKTDESLIADICKFIQFIHTKIPLTLEDISDLYVNPSKLISETIISLIVANKKEDPEEVAQTVLTNCLFFSVPLALFLIGHIKSQQLAYSLFLRILRSIDEHTDLPRKKIYYQFYITFPEYVDSIMEYLRYNADENPEHARKIEDAKYYVEKLGIFLMKTNNEDFSVSSFLTKLISVHENVPEIGKILLDYLGPNNPTFSIEKYDVQVYDQILDLILKGTHDKIQTERLTNVLVQWIQQLQITVTESCIMKLVNIDFRNMPTEIPRIINATIKKCSNNKKMLKNLAIQIAISTVKPRNAQWAMKTITYIYSGIVKINKQISDSIKNSAHSNTFNSDDVSSSGMSNICDILLKHLSDDAKYRNAIYMIMWQAMIECDFYNLQERSFFSQKIAIEYKSKNEFLLSFHPYHSMRRLYAAVSNIINLPISHFTLYTKDDDKELKLTDPLTNFNFDINTNTAIYLKVETDQLSENEIECVSPKFLTYLEQPDNTSLLSDTIGQLTEESEIVYQILHLIDPSFHQYEKRFFIDDIQDFFSTFDFNAFYSIIPLLLSHLSENPTDWPQNLNEMILDCLCDYPYSTIDLSIACRSILKLYTDNTFSKRIVKKCLLDSKIKIIRKTFASLISTSDIDLLSFLDLTIKLDYRTKTKEYFDLIRNRIDSFDNDILIPFYTEMKQFETSYFHDIDDTFIGLISCMKPNLELFNITIDRVFESPTVLSPYLPFCHTLESRKAAFEYISKCYGVFKDNKLNSLFDLIKLNNDLSPKVLSDDLSFTGRNLIVNCPNGSSLGSIISLLANVEPFLSWLFYLDKSKLAPHVLALREFMAILIYSRNGTIDLNDILKFSVYSNVLRVKPEIVLNQLFSVVDNYVDSSFGMSTLFGFEIDSVPYHYLTVKVKGYQTMEQSIRDNLHISNFSCSYCQNPERMITKWPEYFLIHFDRYENEKFVFDQFEFPLFLNSKYSLIGAVLQCNDNRFITLSTNYNDWFVTSKDQVEYFNVADIPAWCYGSNDELLIQHDEFTCAVLLLYRKFDDSIPQFTNNLIKLEPSIEEKINTMNQNIWPSIVFTSQLFVNFALKLNNYELACNTIFRICFRDLEFFKSILPKCKDVIMKTQASVRLFKEFAFDTFGINHITSVSFEASEIFASLIAPTLKEKDDFSRLVEYLVQNDLLNDYYFFINVLIINPYMCEMNSDLMRFSLQYLTAGREKYSSSKFSKNDSKYDEFVKKQREVFDMLMNVISRNLKYKEYNEILQYLFDPNFLEIWKNVILVSDKYQNLMDIVSKHNSNLFSNLSSLPPLLGDYFSKYQPKAGNKQNLKKILGVVDNCWNSLIIPILFSNEKNLRDSILNYMITLLPEPNEKMKNYIQRKIIDETIEKPEIPESAYGFQFVALLSKAMTKIHSNKDICDAYLELLESRICYISPKTVAYHLNDFFTFLKLTKDDKNDAAAEWIFMIIHHILAYDSKPLSLLKSSQISELLTTRIGTIYAIQILYLLKTKQTFAKLVNRSILCGSSFDACFESYYDEHSAILSKLIKDGLIIDNISVDFHNAKPKDLMNLDLLNEIYNQQEDLKYPIYVCMKRTLEPIKKLLLFGTNSVIQNSLDILDNFDEDEYLKSLPKSKSNKNKKSGNESENEFELSSTEEEMLLTDYSQINKEDNNIFTISNTGFSLKPKEKEKKLIKSRKQHKVPELKEKEPKSIETEEIADQNTFDQNESSDTLRSPALAKMFQKIAQNRTKDDDLPDDLENEIEKFMSLPSDTQLCDLTDAQRQLLQSVWDFIKGRPPNTIAVLLAQLREYTKTGKMPKPTRSQKKNAKQKIETKKKNEIKKTETKQDMKKNQQVKSKKSNESKQKIEKTPHPNETKNKKSQKTEVENDSEEIEEIVQDDESEEEEEEEEEEAVEYEYQYEEEEEEEEEAHENQ